MTETLRLGMVGIGGRGLGLLSQTYTLRDQDYFLIKKNDFGSHPAEEYAKHANHNPDWVEDISELQPEITALCDPDESALSRAVTRCQNHGDEPTSFDSFTTFLETGTYDAVIITSPNDIHLEQAIPLLEQNVDILCEKPVATTLAGHDRLIEASEQSSAQCHVGFNLRCSPLYSTIGEYIHDGAIGDLGMITAHNVRTPFRTGFRYERARSGGSLLEKNCHDFDLFNWYAKANPIRVGAFTGQHVLTEDTDISDHATVIVEYDSGLKATLELCLYAPFTHSGHRMYQLRGSDGLLRSALDSDGFTIHSTDDSVSVTIDKRDGATGGHGGADIHTIKEFLSCLYHDTPPVATLHDAKKAAAVAIAADRSSELGNMVGISPSFDIID